MFGIQRNADPESFSSVPARGSSSRTSTSSPARASSSRAPTELEHGTRLAPLIARHAPLSAPLVQHDGWRRPATLSGSSVHARQQREQQHMYAQRHDGDFNKTHIISTRNLVISEPTVHDPYLSASHQRGGSSADSSWER